MNLVDELIGTSQPMVALRSQMSRLVMGAARGARPPVILIQGETGTGKGLVASLLHRMSARRAGPFVDLNCAAIPETLLESELFGYEAGAFTDARRPKPGLFQASRGGTIFLDEIGLLPLSLQAKLLTVLDERAVRRLGAVRKEPVDVWVLAASNADLATEVESGRFRQDLYHRLAVVTLSMPPLRDRVEDIVPLAEHFLARFRADYGLPPLSLEASAGERLRAHPWPGNVRELANVMERAVVLGSSGGITAASLDLETPDRSAPPDAARSLPDRLPGALSRHELMREHLREVLRISGANITRTAEMLGVSRTTVRAQMQRYGLRPTAPGSSARRRRRGTSDVVRPPAYAPAPSMSPPAPASPGLVRWEQRRVTLLRAMLGPPPGDRWWSAGRALQLIGEKIEGFGGQVEDLGPVSLDAAFGLDAGHEAPRRAAHAALAILRAFERARGQGAALPVPRMMIHSGRALVGHVGGRSRLAQESRRGLSASLDSLAAAAGPVPIVVSAEAAVALARRFTLEGHAAQPGPAGTVYGLGTTERSATGSWAIPSPFVGREPELALLGELANDALSGRGRVVGIPGEPGIGKSRLIWEFTRGDGARRWHVLQANCVGGGQTLHHLMAELLRQYFAVIPGEPAALSRTKIEAGLTSLRDDHLRASLPAFLTVLGLPGADPSWDRLNRARRQHLLDAFTRLFVLESRRQPLLLVVEDAHWIDAESQAALDTLVSSLPGERLLLLVSHRSGYEHRWSASPAFREVTVAALAAASARELLDALLGSDQALDALKTALLDRTEGNPFFLEESVRALVDDGVLGGARGAHRLERRIGRMGVPPSVEDVLAARVDRLPIEIRAVLQAAAVVGREFSPGLLEMIADEEDLAPHLDELQRRGLVTERPGPDGPICVFQHALTQAVAYESLLPARRRQLHLGVVEAMERAQGHRPDEHVERLAHHAFCGEAWDKALVYARQAGRKAFARLAVHDAVAFFDQGLVALEHLPDSAEHIRQGVDLRFDLRNALHPMGELRRSFTLLEEAERLARSLADARRLAWALTYRCHAVFLDGHLVRASELGQDARRMAAALGESGLEAVANYFVGIVYINLGQYQASADAFARSIAGFPEDASGERYGLVGPPPVFARAYLAEALAYQGEFARATDMGNAAIRLAEAADDSYTLALALWGSGVALGIQGHVARATAVLERGVSLCQEWNIPFVRTLLVGPLGWMRALEGRCDEGIALLEESLARGRSMGTPAIVAFGEPFLVEAHLRSGRLAEADRLARRAVDHAREIGTRGNEAMTLRLLGEIATRRGACDAVQAEAWYGQALSLATELGMRPLVAHCHRGLSDLFARIGRVDVSVEHGHRATSLYRDLGMPW